MRGKWKLFSVAEPILDESLHLSNEIPMTTTLESVAEEASVASCRRRVLIIVENLPVPFDRRVWSEAKALSSNGYEVSVICPKGKNASRSFEIIDGIHIYRHWLPKETKGKAGYLVEYSVALFWELALSLPILFTRGFDVIQGCNPPDLIFVLGGFYKLICGKRFVFDHHDLGPELYEAKFHRRDWLWRLQVRLERWTFQTADAAIATNESYRRIAIHRGGINEDRSFVVRTGPNLSRIRPLPPNDQWKAGRQFMVAYVGVVGEQDGLDLLVDAVRHIYLEVKRDDIQFVIIGDGPALNSVINAAAVAGVSDAITFVGRVDDDSRLCTILSTADVCVNPDRPNPLNDMSTTIKIMEYMALGKPIVQFDLTEGRNSAQDASLYAMNADPADFGNKILELLGDPKRSREMGAFGLKRVEEVLSWEHEEKKLLDVYKAVFSTLGRTRKT